MTTIVAVMGRGGADPDNNVGPSLHPISPPNAEFTRAVRLLDPSGEEERLYLVAAENADKEKHYTNGGTAPSVSGPTATGPLHELVQVSDADGYTSMLVTPNLVVNQPLFAATPVDPLFWVLSAACPVPASSLSAGAAAPQRKWQPLDQLVDGFDLHPVVRASLDPSQLPHLFQHMDLGGGEDDENFFKFSEDRALAWLSRKRDAARTALRHQAASSAGSEDGNGGGGGGAFVDTFRPSGDLAVEPSTEATAAAAAAPPDGVPAAANLSSSLPEDPASTLGARLAQRADDESVQIVCQYLTPAWREALLAHLQLPRAALEGRSTATPAGTAAAAAAVVTPTGSTASEEGECGSGFGAAAPSSAAPEVRRPPPPVVSNKKPKLKASDARGTQKLTSFFSTKKKK